MSETKIEIKTLDYSDVKYGILRINNGDIANNLPTFYYPIIVHDDKNNKDYKRHMHLSVRNRIDGFTEIYKENNVKEGDSIIMELHKEYEDGKTKYILNVFFKKNYKSSNKEQEKHQRDEEFLGELQNEIIAIQNLINDYECYFRDNEADVRAEIVDRILRSLGWVFPKIEREVKVDYKTRKKADIVLSNGLDNPKEKCEALIETKSLHNTFDNDKSLHQLKGYLDSPRFESVKIGVLTNGCTWIIYKYVREEKNELQKIQHIDIMSNDTLSVASSFFEYLHIEKIGKLENKKVLNESLCDGKQARKGIIIRYNNDDEEYISDTSPTGAFRRFVLKHKDIVMKLQNNNKFPQRILVAKSEKKIKTRRKGKGKDRKIVNKVEIDGNEWYIDTEIFQSHKLLTLIQQIILEGHIEATADYF
jgi:predicted type IV restriction endonuclease